MLINRKGQDTGSSVESVNTKTWYSLVLPWCQVSEWGNLQVWSLGGKTEIKIKRGHNCRSVPLHIPRLKKFVWKIQTFTYPRLPAPSWKGGATHGQLGGYKAVPCSCALQGLSQTSHQTSILTSLIKDFDEPGKGQKMEAYSFGEHEQTCVIDGLLQSWGRGHWNW